MDPLKLYWWKPTDTSKINLGDEIGWAICREVSQRDIVRADLSECELISIGSILSAVYWKSSLSTRQTPCYVWGSGLMAPEFVKPNDKIIVKSVRGHLTRCLVDSVRTLPIGDPGILASDVWAKAATPTHAVGIIPHWSQIDSPLFAELAEKIPGSTIIDMTNTDVADTMKRLSSCEAIISTSLHGLILADSYQIPNVWMKTKDIHKGKSWKFYDYFSSIGRDRFDQVDVMGHIDSINKGSRSIFSSHHHKNVSALKSTVAKAFPAELRA